MSDHSRMLTLPVTPRPPPLIFTVLKTGCGPHHSNECLGVDASLITLIISHNPNYYSQLQQSLGKSAEYRLTTTQTCVRKRAGLLGGNSVDSCEGGNRSECVPAIEILYWDILVVYYINSVDYFSIDTTILFTFHMCMYFTWHHVSALVRLHQAIDTSVP